MWIASEGNHEREVLLECGVDAAELDEFRERLLISDPGSVDSFLEYNPTFLRVGKAAMAVLLVQGEDARTL